MTDKRKGKPERHNSPVRRSQHRSEKLTLLIVCEGLETERNYFEGLKREDTVSRQFATTVVRGAGGSRQQIVQHAVNRKNRPDADFDQVWCIMDIERLNNEETRQDLNAALKIAKENQIQLALSNPSFEVWLLAHFIRTKRHFNDCDAVIAELNKHWKEHLNRDYNKSEQRVYFLLSKKTNQAIENAQNVREKDFLETDSILKCNSSTEVYCLVRLLFGNSKQQTDQ